jgi:hypothetical protein
MKKLTAETVRRGDLRSLHLQAIYYRDTETVALVRRALNGDAEARDECVELINTLAEESNRTPALTFTVEA